MAINLYFFYPSLIDWLEAGCSKIRGACLCILRRARLPLSLTHRELWGLCPAAWLPVSDLAGQPDCPCQVWLGSLIYAGQTCLPAMWSLGARGKLCLLIKPRLPSEVCHQKNSNGRHVTFCDGPFGISLWDIAWALCASFDPVHVPYCLFPFPKFFWGGKDLLGQDRSYEIKG